MNNDSTIQQNIISELNWEPSVNPTHIGVAVDNGVATLSGHVATYAEKRAAQAAAARVKGVRAVAVEIDVRLPAAKKNSDDEIAARAAAILQWDDSLPADRIKVSVEHGVVTLTGTVSWQYQRQAAEHDVHKLSGVVAINNLIAVDAGIRPKAVHVQIEQSFERMAQLDAKGVAVAVDGRRVILTGTVHSSYERELAEHAAWSAPGVTEVDDRLTLQ